MKNPRIKFTPCLGDTLYLIYSLLYQFSQMLRILTGKIGIEVDLVDHLPSQFATGKREISAVV